MESVVACPLKGLVRWEPFLAGEIKPHVAR
jgi:hypothetical protein